MKKLFLIPLMTLFSCVIANATVHTAGTIEALQSALAAAQNGDEIQLTADIALPSDHSVYLNITKSITLDGQGRTLSGYGNRGSAQQTIAINYNNSEKISVVLKNLNITTPGLRPIDTRGNLISLELDNVNIVSTAKSGNAQGITFSCDASADASIADLIIKNSSINATASGYPIIFWNPANVIAENSTFAGYCGLYFKLGSFGTIINAENCQFDAPNVHSGKSNAFAVFAFEDAGIKMNLTNCGMNAEQIGDQSQRLLDIRYSIPLANRTADIVDLTIDGDNSYFNAAWSEQYTNPVLNQIIFTPAGQPYTEESIPHVKMTIKGGTYSFDPTTIGWYDSWILDEGNNVTGEVNIAHATIPDGYEVKEIKTQQGDVATNLYRVRKTITTSNSINDNVENKGAGQNENTEFLISSNETVAAESTVANYVEVSNNASLTIPSGKTLEVTNGLDVTDGATLVVEAGSTLVVGEGGVTAENTDNIVITADENGSASFLLDPKVIVNTTPNLTVKMTANEVGYETFGDEDYYYWFRFAAPVAGITELGKDKEYGTYIYQWNYAANDWGSISALSDMKPFNGYSLTTNHKDPEDVTYTFKGQLAGNQNMNLDFKSRGYNYFGNSYTGYIDVHALVAQLMENENIDGSIYLWDNENQSFYPVTLGDITSAPVEIAPMQTFILRQINTGEAVSTELNYASAIWGNPRYGKVPAAAPARRYAKTDNVSRMNIVVTAANGKKDYVTLKEADAYSNDFEKGFDALKYMNERTVNLYTTIDGENYGIVATDNLEGMKLSFQTVNEIAYTLSFENINGAEYAIRDNATGVVIAIEEGSTYDFNAQPNSTVEGRFEIVNVAKVATGIENAEVKANVKGIYTITGQYVGEDFEVLPAGVYVVNGVKIVK